MQIKSKNKTILITGGCGFIGSHLSLLLKKKNFRVIVIDNLSIGKKLLFKGDKFYKADISKKSQLEKIFKENNIFAIFHLAGLSKLTESFKKKKSYKINNIKGTQNIIEIAKKYKVRYLIFSSSASVYGKQKKFPISENSPLKPISYYGKTKLNAEKIIKKNKSKFISFLIARIFSIYHIKQKKPFLFPSIKERIKYNKKKLYVKNAFCVRDFLNAELVVDIIYKIYIKKLSGIYNIGSGKGISVKSFIEKKFKLDDIIISNHNVNYLVSNNNKINKKLNGRKI